MKESDISAHRAAKISRSNADVEGALDAMLTAISDAPVRGESPTIAQSARFAVKRRPARNRRSPRTGWDRHQCSSTAPVLQSRDRTRCCYRYDLHAATAYGNLDGGSAMKAISVIATLLLVVNAPTDPILEILGADAVATTTVAVMGIAK